jgi:hypothetical protein
MFKKSINLILLSSSKITEKAIKKIKKEYTIENGFIQINKKNKKKRL